MITKAEKELIKRLNREWEYYSERTKRIVRELEQNDD